MPTIALGRIAIPLKQTWLRKAGEAHDLISILSLKGVAQYEDAYLCQTWRDRHPSDEVALKKHPTSAEQEVLGLLHRGWSVSDATEIPEELLREFRLGCGDLLCRLLPNAGLASGPDITLVLPKPHTSGANLEFWCRGTSIPETAPAR